MGEALTPDEQSRLAGAGANRKRQLFFRLWTMKEALIKALGTGFSLHVSEFEIPPSMWNGQRLCEFRFPHSPEVCWRLENLGNREFAAAIAHERG
jgi:phosphopantetheine--protein transferase-like protein